MALQAVFVFFSLIKEQRQGFADKKVCHANVFFQRPKVRIFRQIQVQKPTFCSIKVSIPIFSYLSGSIETMEHQPSFLQLTAEDLYARFGDKLSEVAVVFPNNRARLFFSEHLYQAAGKPVWTPAFITISDLFRGQSDLQPFDTLGVVGLLHDIYLRVSGKEESFDEFYHWGEILLSDFDDVDKNLADARQLFQNIREQAEYTDTLEHLTEDQVDSIRLFFKNFNPDRKTELKERFLENWNILYEVYTDLNNLLLAKGLAYEGMLHRRVTEKLRSDGPQGFPYATYAFVGFNVLNECEKLLFSLLHKVLTATDRRLPQRSRSRQNAAWRHCRKGRLDFSSGHGLASSLRGTRSRILAEMHNWMWDLRSNYI